MRVAFVHHHFRQGGVSRVISAQASVLEGRASVLLVTGEEPDPPPGVPHVVVPSLAYDRDRSDGKNAVQTAGDILRAVKRVWPGGADLYHFHNPTLGKNSDLISVITCLRDGGHRLLLQVHDFAEDGRPWGYSSQEYPADCHYAVINRRDYRILLESGLDEKGLHYLPNMVRPLPTDGSKPKGPADIVLYPVRAIRRKNVGEAVLLSLFVAPGELIGITLEPTGRLDLESCGKWDAFSREHGLSVRFGLGVRSDFGTLLSRTSCMITTSVKEGFGLSFLEPWTGGKMLRGRLIRDICVDFTEKGVRLDHLYERIGIPRTLVDLERFHTLWVECFTGRLTRYGLRPSRPRVEEQFQTLYGDGNLDFGILNEELQMEVIQAVCSGSKARTRFLGANPWLEESGFFRASPELIEHNAAVVENEYSLERSRGVLLGVYNRVMQDAVSHSVDKEVLLNAFNGPEKNFLLLCESAAG